MRHKIQLAPGQKKALFGTVDTPAIDPKKIIWLEPAPAPATAAAPPPAAKK